MIKAEEVISLFSEERKTLKDAMPKEFWAGEYDDTRAYKFRDVVVKKEHGGLQFR